MGSLILARTRKCPTSRVWIESRHKLNLNEKYEFCCHFAFLLHLKMELPKNYTRMYFGIQKKSLIFCEIFQKFNISGEFGFQPLNRCSDLTNKNRLVFAQRKKVGEFQLTWRTPDIIDQWSDATNWFKHIIHFNQAIPNTNHEWSWHSKCIILFQMT